MGLRINTNLASLSAQRHINTSQRQAEGSMKALASGSKFENPNESSAEFAIAEKLRGQIAGVKAGRVNAENAQSFIAIAESGLNEQNNILIRMRELAVQAASDTFSDSERELLNKEFEQLRMETDRIAMTTTFGSNKLLAGESHEYEFQVGAYGTSDNVIKYKSNADTRASSLEIDDLEVTDKSDARSSLSSIDSAIEKIANVRANLGAIHSRMESTINHGLAYEESLQSAHSRIADTDVAQAMSNMYKQQALQQYQLSVLSQANQQPGQVLRLLG